MGTVLDDIVTAHRKAAASDDRDLDALASAAASAPPPRPFRHALARPGLSLIAEIKRRSPSAGDLAPDLVPSQLAGRYEGGGAAALSVLTDGEFFGGSRSDLQQARAACDLPVLRKDFTVCEADIYDARLMGADAVLLIGAVLSDDELKRFRSLAGDLGLAALVEVHTEAELDRALAAGADVVGVNQRDLHTFQVDHDRARRLGEQMPAGVVKVAESGVRSSADVARLVASGYDAVLIGETLVRAADPAAALRALLSGAA